MLKRGLVGDRVINRRDDLADGAAALAVERLECDDVRARCDRVARPVRIEAVAGHDARDVGAVAPVVVGLRIAVHEVLKMRNALARAIGDAQVVVPRRDARIDDRDADAVAAISHQLLHRARPDGHGGAADEPLSGTIVMNLLDARIVRQRLQHGV